jgi:hypothetical protein
MVNAPRGGVKRGTPRHRKSAEPAVHVAGSASLTSR